MFDVPKRQTNAAASRAICIKLLTDRVESQTASTRSTNLIRLSSKFEMQLPHHPLCICTFRCGRY